MIIYIFVPIYKDTEKNPLLFRLRLHLPTRTYNVHKLIAFILRYSYNLLFWILKFIDWIYSFIDWVYSFTH